MQRVTLRGRMNPCGPGTRVFGRSPNRIEMCLTPMETMTPEDVRALRLPENASQAVFARYLNVTTGLVSQWGVARSGRGAHR